MHIRNIHMYELLIFSNSLRGTMNIERLNITEEWRTIWNGMVPSSSHKDTYISFVR